MCRRSNDNFYILNMILSEIETYIDKNVYVRNDDD